VHSWLTRRQRLLRRLRLRLLRLRWSGHPAAVFGVIAGAAVAVSWVVGLLVD
jgi:hypothetical protein